MKAISKIKSTFKVNLKIINDLKNKDNIKNDSSHEPGGGPGRLLGGFAGDTKKMNSF